MGIKIETTNKKINEYINYRYNGFFAGINCEKHIFIYEKYGWSCSAKNTFENFKNQGKYAMCDNYKIIATDDKVLEVFEERLYILSNNSVKKIEFYCPEYDPMTSVIVSRLCIHLHMLLWDEGVFGLHGGATTYNNSLNSGIAIFGNSGMGKTSLVLNLCLNGERLVADDNLFLYRNNCAINAIKNTQYVGLNTDNLLLNFLCLVPYVKETEIEDFSDKDRIDLQAFRKELFVDEISIKYIVLLHKHEQGKSTVELASKLSCLQYLFSVIQPFDGLYNTKLINFIFELASSCIPLHVYTLSDVNSTRKAILEFLDNLEKSSAKECQGTI